MGDLFYNISREGYTQHDDQPLLSDKAFNRHAKQDGTHISPYANNRVSVGLDDIVVTLEQGINEDDFKRVAGMATMATTGIDPRNLPDNLPWEEMLKGGLQTALESQVVVFNVGGISRVCTHQLVRTRKAAFHQQSQRATFMGDRPDTRMPESVWNNPRVRVAYLDALEEAHRAYKIACEQNVSYQDARFILPEGSQTSITCEYPLRTFIETYAYRGCSMFQWEHVHVMREMRRLLVEAHPWLDPYIKISCEKTPPVMMTAVGENGKPDVQFEYAAHHCTFQGWERVNEQCDFEWADEEARVYKPAKELRIG